MIPDYQSLMLPVLKSASKEAVDTRTVIEALADEFSLTDQERDELLPSGKQRTFHNRVHWAKTYLKQAGLLEYPKRGYFIATDEGRRILGNPPDKIDAKFLRQYEAFQDFQSRKGTDTEGEPPESVSNSSATPDEILRTAHKKINDSLSADLLSRVRASRFC